VDAIATSCSYSSWLRANVEVQIRRMFAGRAGALAGAWLAQAGAARVA
jgi:hypothetical protein